MNRYKDLYKSVMASDANSQQHFINTISEERGVEYGDLSPFIPLFVPNDEYLRSYDPTIIEPDAGLYSEEGHCLWTGCLLFPILDLVGDVRGFAAFDPFVYADVHNGGGGNYYIYSSGSIMSKKCYMLGAVGVYKKAYEDDYLCITDGIFDTVSLTNAGFNAMALMGSSLTPEILFQLRFIKNVILVQDNDDAGLLLGQKLQKLHKGGQIFKQRYAKDYDGAIKGGHGEDVKSELKTFLQRRCYINI